MIGSKIAVIGGFACVLALSATSAPTLSAADLFDIRGQVDERTIINLSVDFAEIVRLRQPASTIVIGNPGIAGATLGDERSLILTGRAAGTTNVVVLDAAGGEIAGMVLRVLAGPQHVITFHHGTERRTYSCGLRCEAVLSVGDDATHFGATDGQITARQTFSTPPAR